METVEIEYRGIKLEIEGTYTPSEEQVIYYSDGSGYPGSPSEFDANAVFVQETDIYDLLGAEELEHISELCIKEIEK